jgi:hypothetical protein
MRPAHVLDVLQQVAQVEAGLEQRLDAALRAGRIVIGDAARQRVVLLALGVGRGLQRRLGLVVDALRLAELLVLQLLHVAERFHARRVAVDVARAGHRPARHDRPEHLVAALAQVFAGVAALLEIADPPRHVLRVGQVIVALGARLDDVADRHPAIERALPEQPLRRERAVVDAVFGDDRADPHLELAEEGVDPALRVGRDGELADRRRVVMHDLVEIGHQDRRPGAEQPKLLVKPVQRAVGVGAREHVEHLPAHGVEPEPRLVALREVRVGGREPEPRPGGAGHAGHQSCRQHAQRAGAG